MKHPWTKEFDRRAFIGQCLPACAVIGLGFKARPPLRQEKPGASQAPTAARHKFDTELSRKFTFAQLFHLRFNSIFIPFAKHCVRELGPDKTLELLKAYASQSAAGGAASIAKQLGRNDFEALKSYLSPSNPAYANTLTMTIAESEATVYELHVTECLWAKTFIEAQAGDLGYAVLCFGDYQFANSFNPQIEMVRDKTLMQGDAYCNHRYLWKG